ncbi:ROK family protein [Leucobacter aridicollis]|uniref:Putative NBD/HSP70 family sugar kinase n=1 Tax=Leucobacter aridicollis TaxID=283878 RepID=A0A852RAK2_9MICO|nr:ROK family protein [Leucobacter aridicollis]MBL3683183.1 ROK family protein [Leucobacter aridicollis]NYD25414.1 putative NBD/HSP70 family sugar kinase [Leucobacter aridicollis]
MTPSPRIGLDIGGTKIEGIALDPAGDIVARALVPTVPGPTGVLQASGDIVARLIGESGLARAEFAGVGIGIPGQVDRATGTVRNAYNMGLSSLALGPELAAAIDLPVSVDNDVTAAAVGAASIMRLEGTVAYLNLGTGLAAGVTVDGAPVRGADGFAGEIGHLAVDPRMRPCPCGQRGCLETVASGSALKAHWPAGGEHPGRTLNAAVAAGDADAKQALEYLIDGAAQTIRVLGLTVNPGAFVVGGGLRLLGAPLFDGIRAQLAEWAAASEFIAALRFPERLQVLPEGSPAAAIGAAIAVNE